MDIEFNSNLRVGQLVITEKDVFGIEEKWFTEADYHDKTISATDNFLIHKHSVGIITGFINGWAAPAIVVGWGGDFRGKKLVVTINKVISLDDFIEKIDGTK